MQKIGLNLQKGCPVPPCAEQFVMDQQAARMKTLQKAREQARQDFGSKLLDGKKEKQKGKEQ